MFASANTEATGGAVCEAPGRKARRLRRQQTRDRGPRRQSTSTRSPTCTKPGTTIVVGDPTVPVGAYTAPCSVASPRAAAKITKNVRDREPKSAAIVGKLEQGAVDAGFVYVTDEKGGRSDKLRAIELPPPLQPDVAYGVAVVKSSVDKAARRDEFVDGLLRGLGARASSSQGRLPLPNASGERGRRALARTGLQALLALSLVAVLVFLALPVLAIFVHSPPSRLVSALGEPAAREALLLSLETTTIAMAVILAVGTPAAWLLAVAPRAGARRDADADRAAARDAARGRGHRPAGRPRARGHPRERARRSAHRAGAADRGRRRRARLRLLALLHTPGIRGLRRDRPRGAGGLSGPRRARAIHVPARGAADRTARAAGGAGARVGEGPRRVRRDVDVRRLLRRGDADRAAGDLSTGSRPTCRAALALSAVLVASSAVLLGAIKLAGRGTPPVAPLVG